MIFGVMTLNPINQKNNNKKRRVSISNKSNSNMDISGDDDNDDDDDEEIEFNDFKENDEDENVDQVMTRSSRRQSLRNVQNPNMTLDFKVKSKSTPASTKRGRRRTSIAPTPKKVKKKITNEKFTSVSE